MKYLLLSRLFNGHKKVFLNGIYIFFFFLSFFSSQFLLTAEKGIKPACALGKIRISDSNFRSLLDHGLNLGNFVNIAGIQYFTLEIFLT